MIAVTGATGHLGRLVIAALLNKVPGSVIVGAVRNVEKAKDIAALGVQVRYADYNQPLMWDDALKGVDNVLLVSSNELGQSVRQHRAVIDAAKRAGVKRVAYTSILRADTTPLGLAAEHKATEGLIRASGMPFTLLRNGWYICRTGPRRSIWLRRRWAHCRGHARRLCRSSGCRVDRK
jgi:NAD(P)H dehydrogenase (quinone)